jgi:c-di-GMP-binding flagellar brake protein YcgR
MDELKMHESQAPAAPALSPATETVAQPASVPPPQSYADQRRHPRVRCFLAVQLRPADDQSLLLGRLSDVSLGGCGVESPTSVKTGSKVSLCPLSSAGELWVEGVVVNVRMAENAAGFNIGVRFDEPESPPPNVTEFVRFVKETAARQPSPVSYLSRLGGGKA